MKAKVIKKWAVKGYRGRMAGYRCITKCLECEKEREFTYSKIRKGGGLYCSVHCRAVVQGRDKRMEKHPKWQGGIRHDKRGYILIKQETGNRGYKRQHRLIMEKYLGRKLEDWEWIHHKNGIKDDNRIENFAIVVAETHKGEVRCPYCINSFFIK